MYDFIIIGGGIVGLSTAWQLQQRFPDKRIILLEKESAPACHQTGRNSGVIHAGVYYAPGSRKAEFCRAGLAATMKFCRDHGIPFRQPGKLLVATDQQEYQRMLDLQHRCGENEIAVERLNRAELEALEPNITGVGALLVPDTGIVDYRQIAEAMAAEFERLGGAIEYYSSVEALAEKPAEILVTASNASYRGRFMVSCAGLQADRLATMMGLARDFLIVPFRGEYYRLPEAKAGLVKHLIYPIPDPAMPFLGVHLTPMIDGSITVGPNALLGWKREGYDRLNFNLADTARMLGFPGFWQVARLNMRAGLGEMRDAWLKTGYLRRVQKYCPQLSIDDLLPHPVGIRAQAVMRDGSLVDDFLFTESKRSLHVCNAPSPAATSAIPIGRYLCDKLAERC